MKSNSNLREVSRPDFLVRKENVRYAFEIWKEFPGALRLLHWNFWQSLEKNVRKQLREHRGWSLEFAHSTEDNPRRARDAGLPARGTYVGFVPSTRSRVYFFPFIEQSSEDEEPIKISLGLTLTEKRPKEWRPDIRKTIEAELGELGYSWRPEWNCPAVKFVDYQRYQRAKRLGAACVGKFSVGAFSNIRRFCGELP